MTAIAFLYKRLKCCEVLLFLCINNLFVPKKNFFHEKQAKNRKENAKLQKKYIFYKKTRNTAMQNKVMQSLIPCHKKHVTMSQNGEKKTHHSTS